MHRFYSIFGKSAFWTTPDLPSLKTFPYWVKPAKNLPYGSETAKSFIFNYLNRVKRAENGFSKSSLRGETRRNWIFRRAFWPVRKNGYSRSIIPARADSCVALPMCPQYEITLFWERLACQSSAVLDSPCHTFLIANMANRSNPARSEIGCNRRNVCASNCVRK